MAKVTDPKLLAELKARFAADPLVVKWTPKRQRDAALGRALLLRDLTQIPLAPVDGPKREPGADSEPETE